MTYSLFRSKALLPNMISRLFWQWLAILLLGGAATGTVMVAMAQNLEVNDADSGDAFQQERLALVAEVRASLSSLAAQEGISLSIEPVLQALEKVPRHLFVPESQVHQAYRNRPLAIGHAQTISQPLIVALMSALADIKPGDKVLEIGTGSGYQAAVLGELAEEVYSIEIIEPLGRRAEELLNRLQYENIRTRIGDGYLGWPEQAPFDAIVVTAAPEYIPAPLVEQLKPGGRLVLPVGEFEQELVVVEKLDDGTTRQREVVPVRFVPLTREE